MCITPREGFGLGRLRVPSEPSPTPQFLEPKPPEGAGDSQIPFEFVNKEYLQKSGRGSASAVGAVYTVLVGLPQSPTMDNEAIRGGRSHKVDGRVIKNALPRTLMEPRAGGIEEGTVETRGKFLLPVKASTTTNSGSKHPFECLPPVDPPFPAQHPPPTSWASLRPRLRPCDPNRQQGCRGKTESTTPVAHINYVPGHAAGCAVIISGAVAMKLLFDRAAASRSRSEGGDELPTHCSKLMSTIFRKRLPETRETAIEASSCANPATSVISTLLTPRSEETADYRCYQGVPRHR
jgi:hypothetical protein